MKEEKNFLLSIIQIKMNIKCKQIINLFIEISVSNDLIK